MEQNKEQNVSNEIEKRLARIERKYKRHSIILVIFALPIAFILLGVAFVIYNNNQTVVISNTSNTQDTPQERYDKANIIAYGINKISDNEVECYFDRILWQRPGYSIKLTKGDLVSSYSAKPKTFYGEGKILFFDDSGNSPSSSWTVQNNKILAYKNMELDDFIEKLKNRE